jgi:hypothetical protein
VAIVPSHESCVSEVKSIMILWWIFFKRVFETFLVAAAFLKNPIKRCQAQKGQSFWELFTGGYEA